MLVTFNCLCCDNTFEEDMDVQDTEEISDDMLPECPDCDCADDVVVAESPAVELFFENEDDYDDDVIFEDDEDEDECI